MIKIIDATFIGGYTDPEKFPRYEGGEVGVIGRSNVGKSTLLNRLCNRKNLARVSSRPGRTLEMNVFEIQFEKPPSRKRSKFNLIDLPGFGFAKVDHETSRKIFDLVTAYLSVGHPKKAFLLLVDARRDPGEEEVDCQASCSELGVPLIVVMTKVDKLSNSEKIIRKQVVGKALHVDPSAILESGEKISVVPVWKRIMDVMSVSSPPLSS